MTCTANTIIASGRPNFQSSLSFSPPDPITSVFQDSQTTVLIQHCEETMYPAIADHVS
jgi:hypothetical protein